MPFTPQQLEYYKQYILDKLDIILSDRDKLIQAIADLQVLKRKDTTQKLTTIQAIEALNKYKPLTYDAIAKDFDIDNSVSNDTLSEKFALKTKDWSPAVCLFFGAALYQALQKTTVELEKNMANDNVDGPDVVTDVKAPEGSAAANYQAIYKYIKEGLWKELDNIEEVRKAFECHQTINSLIELCNEKPLTKEQFQQILFQPEETEEGKALQRQALKSIMVRTDDDKVDNLIDFINSNKETITNLSQLDAWRANQVKQLENTNALLANYGLDQSPIKFDLSNANFEMRDGINQLHKEQQNPELHRLIGAASLSLSNYGYSEDCKKNLVKNFTTLNGATKSIYETCMAIAESPNTNPEQRSAIYTHQDNLTTATLTYATNVIRGPETGNETPAQAAEKNKADYMTNVKASEVTCRSKIDDTVGRKVLSALTNFLSHVTIVGMVANVINKCKTGEWLLFKHKNESRELKKLDKEITDKTYTAPAA